MNPTDNQNADATAKPAGSKITFTKENALEVRMPSQDAVRYLVSVGNLLLNSALITPDMGLSDKDRKYLIESKWELQEIEDRHQQLIQANMMAKFLVGLDFQMTPIESLQEIDIVKGRVFIRYPRLLGNMESRGIKTKWVERSNERAAIECTRGEGRDPELFEFTFEDAKMAGLTSTYDNKPGMYQKRPRVMLAARVISEAYRMTGGKANTYTPEEREEIEDSESTRDQRRIESRQQQDDNPFVSNARMTQEQKEREGTATPSPVINADTVPGAKSEAESHPDPAPAAETTKAAPAEPAPSQRRRAKETTPAPAPAPAPAKADPAPETSRPEPAGDNASPASTATVIGTRLLELTDAFPKENPPNTVKKFVQFFCGLFAVTSIRDKAAECIAALPYLEGAIEHNSERLLSVPKDLGDECRASIKALEDFAKGRNMPAPCVQFMLIANAKWNGPAADMDMRDFLVDIAGLDDFKTPADLLAFFRLMSVTRKSYECKKTALKHGLTMTDYVGSLERHLQKPITESTEDAVVASIMAINHKLEGGAAAAQQADPSAAAEPAKEDESNKGADPDALSLFR